jgi:hypothetical protein
MISAKPTVSFVAALAAAFFLLPGIGNGQEKKASAQQERMKACNAQAGQKSLQGRERQEFMSTCLKAERGEKQLTAQQERMKTCNAQAASKALQGADRQQFMSACLKGESASAGSGPQERMRSCNAQASAQDLKGEARKTFMSRCLSG